MKLTAVSLAILVLAAPGVAAAQSPVPGARPAPRTTPAPAPAPAPRPAAESHGPGEVAVPVGATVSTSCRDAVVHVSICKSGACTEVLSYPTAPYGCNQTGHDMNTSCRSAADCSAGAGCNVASSQCVAQGYTCADPWTVQGADGVKSSCSPYQCKAGRCWTVCSAQADCAPGYSCFNSAACVKNSPK